MSLKNFLTSRVFVKQLILAIILVFIVLIITMQALKKYTHHGESFPVPVFIGLIGNEIENTAIQNNLKTEIIDSVYSIDALPGAVVDQEPEAGFRIKQNRTVFLTINSVEPEKVALPKLTDISFRQAQVLVENVGLLIGNISYEPSEFNDLVLRVELDSTAIKPGTLILKGGFIDLVVGRSVGNEETTLPDLTGFTVDEAKTLLTNAMLNMGVVIYDESVKTAEDSLSAVVWKQYPASNGIKQVNLGSAIDLWLTMNSEKLGPVQPLE